MTVLLVVGDPGDRIYLDEALGLTANGSVTGYLYLNVWPSPENLDRVEAMAVHEFDHNVRYAPGGVVWDPATVTVGSRSFPRAWRTPRARAVRRRARPRADRGAAPSRRCAVRAGHREPRHHRHAELRVVGPRRRHRGAVRRAPIGIPTGAGYAVGNRLVDAYLAATGLSASEAVHADAREIIATAS